MKGQKGIFVLFHLGVWQIFEDQQHPIGKSHVPSSTQSASQGKFLKAQAFHTSISGANIFYYLFWINFLLGIFNALPAVPLDGGYVFRDVMHGTIRRLKPSMDKKRREAVINSITISLAFFVLILLMMTLMGPYILRLF